MAKIVSIAHLINVRATDQKMQQKKCLKSLIKKIKRKEGKHRIEKMAMEQIKQKNIRHKCRTFQNIIEKISFQKTITTYQTKLLQKIMIDQTQSQLN